MRRFPKLPHPEFRVLKKLNSPRRIQDFLDSIPINHEPKGDTLRSPLMVLRRKEAHCIEAALLAAAALWYHGKPPLLLDLKTPPGDFDHVIALFKNAGRWGALSKTNHAVLRYRDPIYRTLRELVLSFFHEYFLDSGTKTLRSYSKPFDLTRLGDDWLTREDDLWDLEEALDRSAHLKLFPAHVARRLRPAHPLEIEAGKLREWKSKPGKRTVKS